MKILKKILNCIFNPINNVSFGKNTEKLADVFNRRPFLIFLVAVVVTAITILMGIYFF